MESPELTGAPNPAIVTGEVAAFRAALPDGGMLLGIDTGTKTLGVAMCDASWRFASPGKPIVKRKFTQDKAALAALIAERGVKGIVVGLPLNMDSIDGPRAQSARAFARNLAALGLPILLWDERWSTVSAERALIEQDMSRARRAERIDSAAAATILQAAIDALTGGMTREA